ncbi:MAG: M3 family oligoendopeptidase [Pseudomonadota bacterium]
MGKRNGGWRLFNAAADGGEPASELGPLPSWDLSDLYAGPDDPAIDADLRRAAALAEAFDAQYRGAFQSGDAAPALAATIAAAIADYEALLDLIYRLGGYASLLLSEDRSNSRSAKLYGDVTAQLNDVTARTVFFSLELNALSDEAISAAAAEPSLAQYRYWLSVQRAAKPYQLGEELERLLHEKSVTGRTAWVRAYDDAVSALRVEHKGERLNLEQALHKLSSPDGETRAAMAGALAGCFSANADRFAFFFNTLLKDKEIEDRWRGYPDMASDRHLANQVEPEVVAALASAVKDAYPRLSHRYYALKARRMGLNQLNYWDRNAPTASEDERVYSWDEARDVVLDAYGAFSGDMAAVGQTFFEKGWIDAPARDGKASGAFAHPVAPSAHPYLLLNYQGAVRDVMTLAHELGHGVHQRLAAPHGPLNASTPLTLAETASVFGEMLTFRELLKSAETLDRRRAMLSSKIEDMLNTVVRQTAFYDFERRLHEERRSGEMEASRIGEIWLEVQGDSLGPSVRLNEGYESYWCYISHFLHAPFYVYAYAFGDCLVNALYTTYTEEPDGFDEKYLNLLRAGGAAHHSDLLAPFGLDARDPAFWRKGLNVIEGLIDELERIDG